MENVYLARQPIYNSSLVVIGYELLFRNSNIAHASFTDGDEATSQVLTNALIEFGLDTLVGDKLAFINITEKYILGELPFPLGKDKVVLEVLECVLPDATLNNCLHRLRNEYGYTIALDDFILNDQRSELMQFADYVKVDVLEANWAEIESQLNLLRNYPVKLIAEKVETQAHLEKCLQLGFHYFQGYFFCKPNIVQSERTPSSQLAVLQMLTQLQDPNLNIEKLESIIARDVSFSYRILRYINSAQFTLTRKVNSIREAINLLGIQCIKTWITIMSLTKFDDKPYELMITSLVRAKMCELLAKATNTQSNSDFVVGLFSLLDALIDKPMQHVVEKLPLSEAVNNALVHHSGKLGALLKAVIAYEQSNFNDLEQLNFDLGQMSDAYMQAIEWTSEISAMLLRYSKAA